MLQLITLIILTFGQQNDYVDQEVVDKNFTLIEDFEKSQALFSSDTFDLVGHSTDGGELIAFHDKSKDYFVFDIWLFGESGKIHATYWTDKKLNFKIFRRTDFKYDKPYYEMGYSMTEVTEYISYSNNSVRRYTAEKKELKDKANEKQIEGEDFFKAMTRDLKLVK